jgi:hypothetical protein
MYGDIKEGHDYLVPAMGVVHVVKVFVSGAAIVLVADGTRWLVANGMMFGAQPCLFTEA